MTPFGTRIYSSIENKLRVNIFKRNTFKQAFNYCIHCLSVSNKFHVLGFIVYAFFMEYRENPYTVFTLEAKNGAQTFFYIYSVVQSYLSSFPVHSLSTPLLAKLFNVFTLSMIETTS